MYLTICVLVWEYILDMWQKYSLGVLFIVDIFVNGLICAAHSFVRFIKLVDSINWVFLGIHILFSALCAFACTARIKGTGREAVAVSLLLCRASYTGGEHVCSYQLCTGVNCNPFDKRCISISRRIQFYENNWKPFSNEIINKISYLVADDSLIKEERGGTLKISSSEY